MMLLIRIDLCSMLCNEATSNKMRILSDPLIILCTAMLLSREVEV